MLTWLRKLFAPSPAPSSHLLWFRRPGSPDPMVHGISPPDPPLSDDVPCDWRELDSKNLAWISESASPFGVRCLDCRPFCLAMTSTAQTKEQLDSFVRGRSLTASHFADMDYSSWQNDACSLSYPHDVKHTAGVLYLSLMLEDKWDLFRQDDFIYFVRSWSGEVTYRIRVRVDGHEMVVHSISYDAVKCVSGDFARREVDFVLRSLLYKQLLPHPMPEELCDAPSDMLAQFSYMRHGRWGYFATADDMTTRLREPFC